MRRCDALFANCCLLQRYFSLSDCIRCNFAAGQHGTWQSCNDCHVLHRDAQEEAYYSYVARVQPQSIRNRQPTLCFPSVVYRTRHSTGTLLIMQHLTDQAALDYVACLSIPADGQCCLITGQ